jgi:hypothetical protein
MKARKQFPFSAKKTQIGMEFRLIHIHSTGRLLVPKMSSAHREYRKGFAEAIQTEFQMLVPWLFSDESSITMNSNRLYVWRAPDMLNQDNIWCQQSQSPLRVMVWGAIARDFKSPLMRIEGTLNADGYKTLITNSHVIEDMKRRYGKKAWLFQDDGASVHRAKKSRAFLAEQCYTLSSTLHWPPHSPDLNVIENL